jgi:S1-C subfamily serine protease
MEMIRRSGQQGVPVITLGSEVVVGFDRRRLEDILARPPRARPSLGARVAGAEAMGRRRGLVLPAGAYVGQVTASSPAERAGLREGDVIVSLGGAPVRGVGDLERGLGAVAPGQSVEVVWWRRGRELRGYVFLEG